MEHKLVKVLTNESDREHKVQAVLDEHKGWQLVAVKDWGGAFIWLFFSRAT